MSVSTVALVLSAYYLFIWKPTPAEPLTHLRRATDSPTTSHHFYKYVVLSFYLFYNHLFICLVSSSSFSRQTFSVLQAPLAASSTSGLNARRSSKEFLPPPQSLVGKEEEEEEEEQEDQTGPSSPPYSSDDGNNYDDESKSTSTPQRAPASAPELGRVSRTTPNLLKIIAPTMAPIS